MKIGIVGAGRIGGGIARQLADVGHEMLLSFSRDPQSLERLADPVISAAGVAVAGKAAC